MSTYVNEAMRGALQANNYMQAADKASADIDEVNLFARFIRKADEAAQAGM